MNLARAAIFLASVAIAAPVSADDLKNGFESPPNSARPRVWWHWMNGNVTIDGIDKDLDWMQRIGIGGLQNVDANLSTPQIVEKRLVYMDSEWKKAFRYAVEGADKRGLEFAIAASLGPQGLMQADIVLAAAERRLIDRADEIIVLADASKFKTPSGNFVCGLEEIDVVISDDRISDIQAKVLESNGIKLIIAA
jgi:hypothetical protein